MSKVEEATKRLAVVREMLFNMDAAFFLEQKNGETVKEGLDLILGDVIREFSGVQAAANAPFGHADALTSRENRLNDLIKQVTDLQLSLRDVKSELMGLSVSA